MKEIGKTQFSFTIERDEKERLENAAKEMGISFTDLLKTGAAFYAGLDSTFRKWIQDFSRELRIQDSLVLQNLAISWLARRDAESEVRGFQDPLLEEFQFTDKGPITGEPLHRLLKEKFVREFEAARIAPEERRKGSIGQPKQTVKAQNSVRTGRKRGLSAPHFSRADVEKSGLSETEYEEKILAEMKAKRERAKLEENS